MIALILMIAAFLLFLFAALAGQFSSSSTSAGTTPSAHPWSRINLVALGLACWVLATLLGAHGA